MRRYAIVLAVLMLAVAPAAAWAAIAPGGGLAAVEEMFPSKCSEPGAMTVIDDPAFPRAFTAAERATIPAAFLLEEPNALVWGAATGLQYDEATSTWHTARCEYHIAPVAAMTPVKRCIIKIHEYLHLALEQAEHTGLLDPTFLEPASRELCVKPTTARQRLIALIRFDLPRPDSWTIRCSKTSRRMSCRALRSGSRTRRYRASIRGERIEASLTLASARSAS